MAMRRKVTARAGQSVVDVALQWCGSADEAEAVAKANGLDFGVRFGGGEVLTVDVVDVAAAARLTVAGVVPTTWDDLPGSGGAVLAGVGYSAVGELAVR